MALESDMVKPITVNEKTWRRRQIAKFVNVNPNCKPNDVFVWIMSQVPNPWMLCHSNSIGNIMRRILKAGEAKDGLSISHNIT